MAAERTKPSGLFCLAIYNDQGGGESSLVTYQDKSITRIPPWLRFFWVLVGRGYLRVQVCVGSLGLVSGTQCRFVTGRRNDKDRGMSAWHDWVDWIGGLPFEVAKPELIVVPLRQRGFVLENMKTVGKCGWGCNEYVFLKVTKREATTLLHDVIPFYFLERLFAPDRR